MRKHLHHLHIIILTGIILLVFILILINMENERLSLSQNTTFGVSFTPSYAKDLGLDPKETYNSLLTELNVKNLRLSAHWDGIEPIKDSFNFRDLDWYIDQASQNHAQVILAIGYKLPRWPECRKPDWLKSRHPEFISGSFLRERQLLMLEKVIEHYEDNPTITSFQLENEPLLEFGECPKIDRDFFKKEVEFVRNKKDKPIIITDSGELRPWVTPMKLSDIFGTTLYRVVATPWIGPFQYPFRPWMYRVKSELIRKIFAKENQKTIISELQAEPWAMQSLTEIPIETQLEHFSLEKLKENVDFARRTGFSESYLWGVEWWFYLKENNHPEYLEFAKSLFK